MRRLLFLSLFSLQISFLWPACAARAAQAPAPWGAMSDIEAAAKKEGKLVVYRAPGHISPEAEQAITQFFKERYVIAIEWTTLNGGRVAPRVMAEQRTKQYVVDIVMNAPIPYFDLKPKGYVVPILAPSTLEKGVWRLDPAIATAKDRDWLYINMPLSPSLFLNTNLIRPAEEPKSYRDLLDSKWKAKIVLQTPATGGTGSGWFRATHKKLGLDYMRALAKQVVLVANVNDTPDAVARGQYPIGVAASPTRARELIREGAPVKYAHPKEGSHVSVQGIMFIANAPHPNAAKLFFHWLYTKEGQGVYAPKSLAISVRKDVAQDYLPPDQRYVEGQPLLMTDVEDLTPERSQQLVALGKQIFEEGK